jgi:DNA-binding response OmpR family regulator
VAGLRLDPAGRRLWRGDEEIRLTAREFAVLEYLVRRVDQVVTKSEILGAVWDFEFEGDPNNVEVYVRRIRRKIDEPFGLTTIETIRGAGYRLNGQPG